MKHSNTTPESDAPTTSNNLETDNETETSAGLVGMETTIKNVNTDESNIWKEKPIEDTEKMREREFEEYLADLFV